MWIVFGYGLGLRFTDRAEEFHLLSDRRLDGFTAGSEQFSRVKALALEILACLDVLTGSIGKGELAFGIDVDLRNAEGITPVFFCTASSVSKESPFQFAGYLP